MTQFLKNVRGRHALWLTIISAMVHFTPIFALNSTDTTQVQHQDYRSVSPVFSPHASTNAPIAIIWIIWITLLGRNAVPVLAIATIFGISDAVLAGITALPFLAVISVTALPLFMAASVVVLIFLAIAGIVALPLIGIAMSPVITIASLVALVSANIFVAAPVASSLTTFKAAREQIQRTALKWVSLETPQKSSLVTASNRSVFHPFNI